MEQKLTHFDEHGRATMVDVAEKQPTRRVAVAGGCITMNAEAFAALREGRVGKGDVLGVARVAGIMGAKQTSALIPMCHPLMLDSVSVEFTLQPEQNTVQATCRAATTGKTGVEMEALTGVNVALLTVYDMCKALDKAMCITGVRLLEKQGGKSGHYLAGPLP